MGKRPSELDPAASQAALFGSELRVARLRNDLTLADLGHRVHVSGAMLGKIEKAQRRPRTDLISRLDDELNAAGRLRRLGAPLHDDPDDPADIDLAVFTAETAVSALRSAIDGARDADHGMRASHRVDELVANAKAAERVHDLLGRRERPQLQTLISEAYQLAGWMAFDQGRPIRSETLLAVSRDWAVRAGDTALAAYVLGPSMSFVATYGGDAALGVERAYGAIGWARRSGNRRLTAFAMSIGARAHARLREPSLCLDLLDRAVAELDEHVPDDRDGGWLSVFDSAALDGHRGSCLLDLGMPDRALEPLAMQDGAAAVLFVRNRILWQLDRVEALLRTSEIEQACAELISAADTPGLLLTHRARGRFLAIELRLLGLPRTARYVDDAMNRVRQLIAVSV